MPVYKLYACTDVVCISLYMFTHSLMSDDRCSRAELELKDSAMS